MPKGEKCENKTVNGRLMSDGDSLTYLHLLRTIRMKRREVSVSSCRGQ